MRLNSSIKHDHAQDIRTFTNEADGSLFSFYLVGKLSDTYAWSGSLPSKQHKNPRYSNKVFLGGIPWDMTENGLLTCFKQFGSCVFEWPGKDIDSGRHPPKGF